MADRSSAERFSVLASKVLFEVQISIKRAVSSLEAHYSSALQNLQLSKSQLQSLPNDNLFLGFLVFLTAFFGVCLVVLGRKTSKTSKNARPHLRLSALRSFIVPTHSSKFDPRFASFTRTGLTMDLPSFLEGILSGTIELRNPMLLQALFRDQLMGGRCGGVLPHSGIQWKVRVLKWVYSSHIETRAGSLNGEFIHVFKSTCYGSTYLRTVQESPQQTVLLDSVPQQDIETTLSAFLSGLCTERANIIFTARNPCVRFMSESFLFSAVPYITRNYTATPLFSSLDHIISYISGFRDVKILSVTNDSEAHAQKLYAAENDLVEKNSSRIRFLERHGERSWREHRLRLVWEAGLHESGLLTKWVIVVTK
ncbi:hypothetical protein E1B28_009116 [Marasmius oreades]|uniref:Uncharacterized protein n=1 Tax=Marasmius oreades TaxID=181124 RepID=A0A9P7S0C8_9AGAR|nr:uncharacterized protein E1B28_009116 [Marasmius oreades]KAG7092798.1 hypothetical protein E1B28_009116 [Marasmius oreades]